jgi:very-short-patch-repair endonuclease
MVERAKCWSDKNKDKPEDVKLSSGQKRWFNCDKCCHEFCMMIRHIASGSWCRFCADYMRCDNENCETCRNKSFAMCKHVLLWSNLNGGILPHHVFRYSLKKYWFECDKCHHKFERSLSKIRDNNECICAFCNGKVLCSDNDCIICFNKSFASCDQSKYWSIIRNDVIPRMVFKQSNKKYWFKCSVCQHEFNSSPSKIVGMNRWCPYCNSHKLCDSDECMICYDISFASHEKAKYFSNKNALTPRQLTKYATDKCIFVCYICNVEFSMRIECVNSGCWCGCIHNKTEWIFHNFLKSKFNENQVITQFKRNWCKNKLNLPFDFCLTHLNVIIEIDGLQHFKKIWNWGEPDDAYKRDTFKEYCAMSNGYSVIRLLQEDVLYDKYDWKTELLQNIELVKNCNSPQLILMCKKNEYETFRNSMIEKMQPHPQIEIINETD